ncbi:MAG TPA: ATP-binding protein [Anaerolineales bacterium]|nr:ATP-binding protein [Anaerolineales bacterium]
MSQSLPKLSPEMLVPRLGEYLIQKGLITEDNLKVALDYQLKQAEEDNQILLGQAFIDLKFIDRSDLNQAVTEQILQLRNALQAANRTLERRVEERTAELQQALQRVSELNQLKANFISNISHELRTPLTHIKGYIELLISESLGPVSDEQKHALQVGQQASGRLEGLIEDLIMVSLASRGELIVKLDDMDVRRIVSLTVKSFQDKALNREIELKTNFDEAIPFVQGDSQKIGWVLGQLIDNGIKFTSTGGSVEVGLQREGENLVIVSVTDTGIGIGSSQLKDIFEPFHQLDGSSTRRYGGTGLGLSLVREIVEAHGSMIEVQSEEGHGSTFKFPLLAVAGNK